MRDARETPRERQLAHYPFWCVTASIVTDPISVALLCGFHGVAPWLEPSLPERIDNLNARLGRVESRLDSMAGRLDPGAVLAALFGGSLEPSEDAHQLTAAEAWIRLAQEAGGVAAYHLDIGAGTLTWSDSTYVLYGRTPSRDLATLETWTSAIHPEDRDQVAGIGSIANAPTVRRQYRIVLPDGQIRWIEDRGRVLLDADGQPSRVVGLNIDITEQTLTRQALAESEAQFRFTFEHAAVGVAHVSPRGRFERVNASLCALLGYSRQELADMTFQELTHPDDLDLDLAQLRRLTSGEIDSYSLEKRYIARSGAVVWAELTVSVRRDAHGKPLGYISIVSDCRERRRAQDRLDFVLSELGHRSRNLLSIVQVMIRNSAATATSVEALTASLTERIQGLAMAQDLLISGERTPVDIQDLVHRQMSVFLPDSEARVKTTGQPLALKADAVQNLGLALHELATNACKYGALSAPEGVVDVVWTVDPKPGGRVVLTWRERGGPAVKPPQRIGFGRRVIEAMIISAFDAKVDLSFSPDGLVWVMSAPHDRVSA